MSRKNSYFFDLITIGDSQLDSFVDLTSASVSCQINKKQCLLCLNYAEKIPVSALQHEIAGNAANAAIGSARLGLHAAMYTVLGDDEVGHKIEKKLIDEKVSDAYVRFVKNKDTNYSVVLNYQGERTQLVYNEKRMYTLPRLKKSRWVYLTALGEGSASIHHSLIDYMKKYDVKLAYNPGHHQIADTKSMRDILDFVDLLLVNKEEAEKILGKKDGRIMKQLLSDLHHLGPSQVIITDGPKGAYAHDGKKIYFMPILDVPVVERTGAGDSFSTGVIAAIIRGESLAEALRWGQLNSASVIQYVGPQKGLLTLRVMHRWSKKYSALKAQEL